jgi:hypothetical protein
MATTHGGMTFGRGAAVASSNLSSTATPPKEEPPPTEPDTELAAVAKGSPIAGARVEALTTGATWSRLPQNGQNELFRWRIGPHWMHSTQTLPSSVCDDVRDFVQKAQIDFAF